jgi:hypothetical protein
MPTPNEEVVRKAIVTTDDIAASGKLNDAQSDKFIDYVVDVTGIKEYTRVVRFRNENMNIEKIGVGGRVTVPAAEARDPAVRKGISASKVTLTPVEIMTPFEIGDSFREINLEGDAVEDHIVKMMATQMGNDSEELQINGDTVGRAAVESDLIDGGSSSEYIKDSFMALFNGWLRKADSGNLVDIAGDAISSNVFSKMLNAMPAKFKRDRRNLVFLCSQELEQLYRERVSTRATSTGDAAVNSDAAMTPFGIPLKGLPLFEEYPVTVQHVVLTGTTVASLRYGPVQAGSVIVTISTLGNAPEEAYVEDTDYTIDYTAGTIVRTGGSAIGSGNTVKVTYRAFPQIILTHKQNLIVAIGRDIRIEKDRDIYKRVNQYAITSKLDVQFETTDAVVKAYNIDDTI